MRHLVLSLALSGCVAGHSLRHPCERTPVAAILLDSAVFAVGLGVGFDAQFRSHDTAQGALGYGAAALAWLPMWFSGTAAR